MQGTAKEEIPGSYRGTRRNGEEKLILQSDGGYIHNFIASDGQTYSEQGTWQYVGPSSQGTSQTNDSLASFARLTLTEWVTYASYPSIDSVRRSIGRGYVGKGRTDKTVALRMLEPAIGITSFVRE